jgi:hypothetical protein
MIVNARLFCSNVLQFDKETPFFERSIDRFVPTDQEQPTGEQQFIRILDQKCLIVPLGNDSIITLVLPCGDLRKHLTSNEDGQMVLDMEGVLPSTIDERTVSTLEEDGWLPLNAPRFFELFGIPSVAVH